MFDDENINNDQIFDSEEGPGYMPSDEENNQDIDSANNPQDEQQPDEQQPDEEQPDDSQDDDMIRSMPKFKVKKTANDDFSQNSGSESNNGNTSREQSYTEELQTDNDRRTIMLYDGNEYSEQMQTSQKKQKKRGDEVKKQRKRKGDFENENENERERAPLDPKELEIQELNREIDVALKSGKASRKRKTNEIDTDVDEEIHRIQEKMRNAADADFEDNKNNLPAIHKVQLLAQVSKMLGKPQLFEPLLENNILDTLRLWLEPLDNGSLPNIDIQSELLNAMMRLPIRTDHLRDSGIGKIVLFMSKCDRYPERHRRMADKLVQQWARPILRRSSNFRDRVTNEKPAGSNFARNDEGQGLFGRIQVQTGNAKGGHSFHASIPRRGVMNYTVMPKSSVDVERAMSNAKNVPERLKRLKAYISKSSRK
ncbi:hypothetical protein BB558_005404 [Smittium angustum]|uniref:TFIIS N-terminal domain-containing protein n=1 Tax=Smittium angustum TaxID=133377 RepID=A0A2U1J0K9_SMIAN|nr:hypothetical protein BB558_005404 [Smittium angustum]